LKSIAGMVKARRTTYNKSSITYILDNITIEYEHNSGKQESSAETDMAKVEGAKIEFSYKFNYTKIENRNNITGSGYGTLFIIQDQYCLTISPTIKILVFAKVFFAGEYLLKNHLLPSISPTTS
jgi:hypothetical protein